MDRTEASEGVLIAASISLNNSISGSGNPLDISCSQTLQVLYEIEYLYGPSLLND